MKTHKKKNCFTDFKKKSDSAAPNFFSKTQHEVKAAKPGLWPFFFFYKTCDLILYIDLSPITSSVFDIELRDQY